MNTNKRQIGGDHYVKMPIDVWEFLEANLSVEEFKGYLKGNIIKYLMRKKYNSDEDLLKAQHCLEKLTTLLNLGLKRA